MACCMKSVQCLEPTTHINDTLRVGSLISTFFLTDTVEEHIWVSLMPQLNVLSLSCDPFPHTISHRKPYFQCQ